MHGEIDRAMREGSALPKGDSATEVLERRRDELLKWMRENCPNCPEDQKHLDEGTEARAYWHYGYLVAVKDVLALIGSASTPRH